jgi:hypothetical protein
MFHKPGIQEYCKTSSHVVFLEKKLATRWVGTKPLLYSHPQVSRLLYHKKGLPNIGKPFKNRNFR